MKKVLASSVALTLVFSAQISANETSSESAITRLISYSKATNDVYVSLGTNGSTCTYGYFIDKDTPSRDSLLSMLLAAYHSQSEIIITAYENNRWDFSSNPVCEIYSVQYKR